MKTMKTVFKLATIFLMVFAGCKKNSPKPDVFNMTNYVIVGKLADGRPYVLDFEAGDKATLTHLSVSGCKYSYTDGVLKLIINEGELVCSFVIENGRIKSYQGPVIISTYDLVAIPATNQLAGKTFSGTYYKPDKSVLHQNFFYSFAPDGNKVGAGYAVGTPAVRIENYTLIGNIAAWVNIANSSDIELMVLINGKLEVGYYNSSQDRYTGSFIQQ